MTSFIDVLWDEIQLSLLPLKQTESCILSGQFILVCGSLVAQVELADAGLLVTGGRGAVMWGLQWDGPPQISVPF